MYLEAPSGQDPTGRADHLGHGCSPRPGHRGRRPASQRVPFFTSLFEFAARGAAGETVVVDHFRVVGVTLAADTSPREVGLKCSPAGGGRVFSGAGPLPSGEAPRSNVLSSMSPLGLASATIEVLSWCGSPICATPTAKHPRRTHDEIRCRANCRVPSPVLAGSDLVAGSGGGRSRARKGRGLHQCSVRLQACAGLEPCYSARPIPLPERRARHAARRCEPRSPVQPDVAAQPAGSAQPLQPAADTLNFAGIRRPPRQPRSRKRAAGLERRFILVALPRCSACR